MLILLAETRKKLLGLWIGFSAAIALLVLAQTVAARYETIEGLAWAWTAVVLLPTLLLLFSAVLLHKNPSKVLLYSSFRAVYAGTMGYGMFIAVTLLSIPLALRQFSMEQYLRVSLLWLLPFQVLLLVILWLMYFRKEQLILPNARLMQEYVSKKSEFALKNGTPAQIQAFQLLIQEDGAGKTLAFLRNGTNANDVILLQGRYARWREQRDLNLQAPDALQRELNNITMAVVDLII